MLSPLVQTGTWTLACSGCTGLLGVCTRHLRTRVTSERGPKAQMPAPHPHPGWPVGISPRARVSPPSWWAPEITDLESGCQMALLSLPASKPQACPGGSWEEKHLKEGPPRRAAHPHCWSLGFWRFSASSRLRGQHSRGGAVCSCCFPLWEGHRAGACLQCSPGAERMSHHGARRDGIPRPARRTGSAWLSPLQPPSYAGAATALMVVVVGSPPEPGRGPVPCPPHPSCERSWEPKVRKPPLLSVFLASVSAARLPLPTWQELWFFPSSRPPAGTRRCSVLSRHSLHHQGF